MNKQASEVKCGLHGRESSGKERQRRGHCLCIGGLLEMGLQQFTVLWEEVTHCLKEWWEGAGYAQGKARR
jgi:hypothetical protein